MVSRTDAIILVMKRLLIVLALAALVTTPYTMADLSRATLRVYRIERDSFDYAFISYGQAEDRRPMVTIKRRDGKLFKAKIGEKVDQYKVVAFVPRTDQVRNPTTGKLEEKKTGRVTLVGERSELVTLELGKLRQKPGWRATLVSLETGERWTVRNGDKVSADGQTGLIDVVSETAVIATLKDGSGRIAMVSGEDKNRLARLWQEQREERQQQVIVQQRAVNAAQQLIQVGGNGRNMGAGRVAAAAGTQPEFFFGTEYIYPSEYQVWVVKQGKEGEFRPIVVPTKFEKRNIGWSYGADGFSYTGVAGHPGYGYSPRYNHKTYSPHPSSTMVPYPSPNFTRFEYRRGPLR